MNFDVYVPAPGALATIEPGSGIVSADDPDSGRLRIDFEGNRYGAATLTCWADRIHQAAGRHATGYPTIARMWARGSDLVRVATFDDNSGIVDLDAPGGTGAGPSGSMSALQLAAAWCQISAEQLPGQLATRSSVRHQMRRELVPVLRSPDPARRFAARQMARRYNIDV